MIILLKTAVIICNHHLITTHFHFSIHVPCKLCFNVLPSFRQVPPDSYITILDEKQLQALHLKNCNDQYFETHII